MNLLQIRPRIEIGGASEYLLTLGEGLTERGHNVVVVSGGGELGERARRFSSRYVDTVPLSSLIARRTELRQVANLARSVHEVARIVRDERVDIIHSHHRFAALVSRIVSTLTGVPLVSAMHELRRDARALTRLGLGQRVVTLSEMMRIFVIETYGVDSERVRVIPMGIDMPAPICAARREELRTDLGLRAGDPVIGCVARLVGRKGHAYLVDAMRDVSKTHPQARLLLVGDGDKRPALETAVLELGLEANVLFLGFRPDVADLLELVDFTVLPSLQEEFGLVLLESLAHERPVVATSIGAIGEIVKTGENGFLVPPHDGEALARSIRAMIDDPGAAREMGKRGRELVERRYTKQTFLDETEALYRDLVPTAVSDH
jgi:glycosyltransferase involved in cell wall biosynthesis